MMRSDYNWRRGYIETKEIASFLKLEDYLLEVYPSKWIWYWRVTREGFILKDGFEDTSAQAMREAIASYEYDVYDEEEIDDEGMES